MDMLIDASAILAVLFNERQKNSIIECTRGALLLAPGCVEYEIGNAVSALYKRSAISIAEGILIWHEFAKIPVRQIVPPFSSALTLAGTEGIYAYDAYYLSCAEQIKVPLLTLDERMRYIAKSRGISCVEV
ncbi:MAG TPA: type II toxin-antitoxin system VapC family toxin [Treponemataceae bacterium]|nr:type II toxin-antitoxin system VapC family toxin [Treponemataceae bacterium]